MPIGIVVLLATAPSFANAVVFAILKGLGSGLTSIVGGTLPLELFGRQGYGSRPGSPTSVKQVVSALPSFAMSMSMAGNGISASLWLVMAVGLAGAAAFEEIPFAWKPLERRHRASVPLDSLSALLPMRRAEVASGPAGYS